MKKHSVNLFKNIDKSWTLFLDRDGVINKRIPDNYVLEWNQFEFLHGVLEALKVFSSVFGKIIIVTNQQGIGKGYMTETDLLKIHSNMISEIEKFGGRVDAVYFSPFLKESNHHTRKPNVGMALQAKKDFPEIDLKKSVMAGDSLSDMEFGHRAGMCNILISDEAEIAKKNHEIVNYLFPDLKTFSEKFINLQ
ncbi:MAG TPA: HAD family hydrolase [Bacteroidales bacterium]|nr:HAD family hydrolase [Bacteroidales bacterium]